MNMGHARDDSGKTRNTLLWAVLLLFFIQLLGMWIESIYRISLITLTPGKELYGLLWLLLPLLIIFLPEPYERRGFRVVTLLFVAARLGCPHLGSVGQILVGGMGVSLFLILLALVFSQRNLTWQGDMGCSVGLAVLVSIALRSWGSSVDISTDGTGVVLAWLLALLVVGVSWVGESKSNSNEAVPVVTSSILHGVVAMVGLFSNVALIYFLLANPAGVCAWSGASSPALVVLVTGIVAVGLAGGVVTSQKIGWVRPLGGLVWNVLFIALLVGGLYWSRVDFPSGPAASAVVVKDGVSVGSLLLYASLCFSPVVVFNLRHLARTLCYARPRHAVGPVWTGMGVLFVLTLFLIVSNVWGYVPYGVWFRNQFYWPFLLAGLGLLGPWFLRSGDASCDVVAGGRLVVTAAIGVAVLAVVGVWAEMPRLKPAAAKRDLTIMTYNMQQGSHAAGYRNYRQQRELLRQLNPDIIGLQECDTARPSGGNVDAVRYLANSLGYFAYYGPGSITGTFGAAILSRYPIKQRQTFFTYSDSDEIGTAMGILEIGGVDLAFFSNHPSGGAAVMHAHGKALLEEAGKYARVIAVGDYNFTAREPYYDYLSHALQNAAMQVGETKINYYGQRPNLAEEIDHIFLSRSLQAVEGHYLPAPVSQTDHPAHWAVVRID